MMNLMMILHEGGPFGLVGMFFNLLFFIGLLALLAWGMMRLLSTPHSGTRADSAEEILRERFARGEIAAEEYENALKTLRDNPPPRNTSRRNYEDYVRDAMERLRSGRGRSS